MLLASNPAGGVRQQGNGWLFAGVNISVKIKASEMVNLKLLIA